MSSDHFVFQRGGSAHRNFWIDEQGGNPFSGEADNELAARVRPYPARKGLGSQMIKTISYLGLGTMGSGMASNLLKAGYQLTVWNRNAEKCEPFVRKGARATDTPADAVRDVDLVLYSLSNDQAVEEVVFGAKGILSGIKEGQIALDMSTVLPATSLREQEAYAKRGVDFLDAPVFGSKQESAQAKLWIMAAGNKPICEKVKPVLEHLGQTVHYFGKNGNAAAMKLVGNLIVALEMEALA